MSLKDKRILLTGAGGGIGRTLAPLLLDAGARLGVTSRSDASAASLAHHVHTHREHTLVVQADVTSAGDRGRLVDRMRERFGGIDILVNLAGALDFGLFADTQPATIPRLLAVNLEAPMQLTHAVLPAMLAQGSGQIVNIGSIFGSIGYPGFAAYSATKFALRGFSQALRRELRGTGVSVSYVAPRAVRTAFNPIELHLMAADGLMHMDDPLWVAERIVRAIEAGRPETYLGQPESFFARLNALLPGAVDRGLRKVVPSIAKFARGAA
ncbi:MAG: SDR family oxidoreductase [Xanthomonadaceae bacterium]|nr:SDR family oxidoreductase [Xanthomonadaceae bacterium]MDE1964497.1 SDR family oxidoreductase [Xanthomonadaceae bacterium]